jgi:hypothetical protein
MLKQSIAILSVFFLWLLVLAMPAQAYYDGDDLGYLDYVTINDQEFENFDERQIVFYPEDLRDGAVIIRGLLEAEQKNIPVTDLHVEITLNGGKSWKAATGNSRWEYLFYPDIERGYDFSIRVVENSISDLPPGSFDPAGELWKIGGFELRTASEVQLEELSGQGSIALGWLNSYLPERLRDPDTQDLEVEFENLQIEADKIIGGEIQVVIKDTLQLPWGKLELHKIIFTATGARLTGSLNVNFEGLTFPDLPLDSIAFSLIGLNGDFSVANADNPFQLALFEGNYGVTLLLNSLVLGVDTGQQVPLSIKDLAGAIQLGAGYGNLKVPNLAMLADQSIGWGQAAVAQGQELAGAVLTIPNTSFKMRDIGGAINLSTKSLSLSGKFQFPDELGGGSVSLPAETPLVLSANGISTSGTLQFDIGNLPALSLSGFPTSLSALSLMIADNIPSGSLAGQVVLTSFANLPLDISADIVKDGLDRLRMATEKETYNFNLADFATLSLSKLAMEYAVGDFSVELDGSITPMSDLVSSVSGIGDSLAFTGLNIASGAITLANDLAGWHELNGASVQIENATLTLSQYGVGVEDNKFWLGLKGTGSLAGATVNATARIFHDGTSEVTGMQLERLYLAYGDFLLKLDRSAVDVDGVVADATQGVIAGLPELVRTKFPTLFNENNELPVQLNGFNVDLAKKEVSLGSVAITPSAPLAFNLGPVSMQLAGMTFSNNGAEIDGSLSLAELGLIAEEIPFAGLNIGSTGFAGEVDLVGLSGVRQIPLLDGEYGFGLDLSELSVAINSQLPAAQRVKLTGLAGSLRFGSGYGDLQVPNLSLLSDNAIAWGKAVVAEGEAIAAEGESIVGAILTIPGTEFKLTGIGGSLNLETLSLSLSGQFQFPQSLGGGSVSLPATTPLVLSRKGISTKGSLQFSAGNLPALDLSGFPTSLSALSLAITDNIPSGNFTGQVVLTSFANLALDIDADINKSGLKSLQLAVEKETYSYTLDDFATLSLTKLALEYDDGDFSVELDGSIVPKNDLLLSLSGIGENLVFSGLTIAQDAITLASELDGWHPITGGSAGFSGATVSLSEYGLGVENNLFWVGLKGQAALGGSSATATARIFHDGSASIDGIDLSNIYFALGDFFLKVAGGDIDEAGAVANNTVGAIGGLPQTLIDSLPAGILNDAQEFVVQLNNFQVDLANRSVSLGSVGYIPTEPFDVTLGPVSLTFAGITFTTSSASIDGSINLAGLGLPVSDIPFADLHLGATGIAGDIDLIGEAGTRTITIIEGESGFSLKLDTLSVNIDTRKNLDNLVSLKTFDGSLLFGSSYNDLEIPDLKLLAGNAISWGKSTAIGTQASLARLTLPGGFAIGDLGGLIDLEASSLSISGTIHLPTQLNNASLTIPVDQPITLSVADGLSTAGPLVFDPGSLPNIPLAGIDTILTGLSLGINEEVISGSLEGDLEFKQFGGLKIAVSADFDSKEGLHQVDIAAGNLNKAFNLEGFASLTLKEIRVGEKNESFYVELDGDITPTHTLFADYQKKVSFAGLRVYKTSIEFADELGGWHGLSDATININAASVSLKKYGLGVSNGLFWFGLKGQAEYMGGEASITAKIFHDKTYEISDLAFDGLYLALGDFSLRTKAEMVDGLISGAGSINAGFLTEHLPDSIKDPLTGELNVSFENLAVDFENRKIIGGTVVLNLKKPLTPNLGVFSAVIRSVSFGFDGASVDGDFSLTTLAGIDIPTPPTGLSFSNIELSPQGFAGSVTYDAGPSPVSLPVFTGDYGITLLLSELTVAVDTTALDLLDKIQLIDLDGRIKLGSGYELSEDLTQLKMLADQGITWGVQQAGNLSEMGEEAAQQAGKEAAAAVDGFEFKIPGTDFHVNNINGRLYLNDKKLKVWGKVQLPSNLGGGSIGLSETSALVLSGSGVSTTGEVDIDPGSMGRFGLAGFSADVQSFSFGVTSNSVSGSLAAKIKLAQFDNIPIGVTASISNKGLSELTVVAADSPVGPYSLAGFADLTLTTIGGSYADGEINVILDGDLALDSTVADVARTFSFSDLSISQSSISMPNIDSPLMFPAALPPFSVGEGLAQLALAEFGFTVKDNLMWIILGGNATILNQTVEGTILISHQGDIDLGTLRADDIVVNFGDFRLTGALALENGEWKGDASLYLGALHNSLDPSILNAFGELPVSVSNLDIDIDRGALNSGTITFDPESNFTLSNDFFTASLPSVSVGVDGRGVFGRIGTGASISFDQGILAGYTEGLSFTGFGLANNGLQVTVTWADEAGKSMTIVPHETYGIDAKLAEIKVAFDSSKGVDSGMFVLKKIDGNLKFGTGYSMASMTDSVTSLSPEITFDVANNSYGFDATGLAFNLPGTDLQIKDFSGDIGFVEQSLTLSGLLAIPYAEGKQIDISVDRWVIDSTGFTGGVSSENINLADIGFDATLTNASLKFSGFSIASAALGMELTLEEFFNLKVAASLALDNNGVSAWSLGGGTNATFTHEAPFATVTVSGLNAGYSSGSGDKSGLFFGLDSNFALKGASLLSGLPNSLVLSGIEVYDGGISINGGVVESGFNGVSATLAGAKIDLTKFALGYDEQFFFRIEGGLSAGPIAADAVVTFYQDATLDLEKIITEYAEGALYFRVELGLSDSEFSGNVAVDVANTITMDGTFILGSTDTYSYWGVAFAAGGGGGVPLGAIPLSLYKVGGGCAYHMTVDAETGDLAKDGSNPFVLIAKVGIGTSDATTWYGDFTLALESSKLTLKGDSWFLTETHSGTPDLEATISLGSSPPLFHVQAKAKLAKKLGDFTMLGVDGEVDLLFTDGDWHIWFGSQDQRLSVKALEYVTGSGYIQLSSDGLALGVRQSFNLEGDWWIFYGRVYGGAEVRVEGGFAPFYIDASGRIWVGLEAGVLLGGDEYEIISAHAELSARFRAPSPTYLMLHGEMRYSFIGGLYRGKWEMDFVMPKGGVEGASMDADISSVPLLATTSPQDGSDGVSRVKEFEIKTSIPLMKPFKYDDGQWYVLTVESPSDEDGIVDFTQQETANKGITLNDSYMRCTGGLVGIKSLKYRPESALGEEMDYQLETTLSLRKFTRDNSVEYRGLHGHLGARVKEETVEVNFTTTKNEPNIREIIIGSYPKLSTTPVYSNTPVHLEVGDGAASVVLLLFFNVELVDPSGQVVSGEWEFGNVVTDEQTGTYRYLYNFTPDEPLKVFHSFTNSAGEKRFASQRSSNGYWLNPFLYPDAQPESDNDVDAPAQMQDVMAGRAERQNRSATKKSIAAKSGMRISRNSNNIGAINPYQDNNEHQLASGMPTAMDNGAIGLADQQGGDFIMESYTQQRENEYTIRIVKKSDGSKAYGSKFYLTMPDEESDAPVYADSNSVIQDSSLEELDAHFFANYSVNHEDYTAQTTALYEDLIVNGRCNVWNRFKSGEFAGGGASDNVSDLYRYVPLPLCSTSPEFWGDGRGDYSCETDAYMVDEVLNSCAPAAAASQALMAQYEQQKEELSASMATVDFRSLELRFKTKAPINWNDVEVEIVLSPDFNGDLKWSLPPAVQRIYSTMCGGSPLGGASFKYKGHKIRCSEPLPDHEGSLLPKLVLSKDGYVIKSRRDGLEHRIELKLNRFDVYRTGKFLRVIDSYLQHGVGVDKIGWFGIYERTIQPSDTGNTFNYGRGEWIAGGEFDTIRTSRPSGSNLQSINGQNTADDYSDVCHICD